MSVATELTRIQTAKADIKASIEAKGVTIPSDALINQYADYVDEIQTGGGTKDYIVEGAVYDPTATYSGAFLPIRQIVTANIPSGFTSIGNDAFRQCSVLTSITIPDSVTSIGDYAFQVCSGLTSITIPDSVTNIGKNAFQSCTGLTSLTIPNSVTSIGDSAFGYCSGLKSIVVDSANTVYDSRDNCNAIIKTSTNELITGCKNTIIPNTVTSIGENAFRQCFGLTSITIPDSVTSISEAVFYDCRVLTSVTIGSSVTSIGSSTFNACPGLRSVTIQATTPPTLGSTVFGFYNYPIYVPAESLEAYKTATNWSTYASRIKPISE